MTFVNCGIAQFDSTDDTETTSTTPVMLFDPTIMHCRGTTYTFVIDAPGHPCIIKTTNRNDGTDGIYDVFQKAMEQHSPRKTPTKRTTPQLR